ncbi:MAG: hypothetical protein JWO36_1086 [Myxococcales bacterium]|nr:hypothetical protein [Myxococcales bacterium]
MRIVIFACCVLWGCTSENNLGNTRQILHSTRWATTLGSIHEDGARSVVIDPAGDVVAGGFFTGTVDFGVETLSTSHTAGWVSKRSGIDGSARWTITLGTEMSAYADVAGVATTGDGSVIVAGTYSGDLHLEGQTLHGPGLTTGSDCFVAKYNPAGQLQWVRNLGPSTVSNLTSLAASHDGRIAIIGAYQGVLQLPNGNYSAVDHDPFLVLFDANGQMLWGVTSQNPGGTVGVQGLFAGAVAMTAEDDVILAGDISFIQRLAGTFLEPNARISQYAARFTLDGHLLWAGVLGPDGVERASGPIAVDPTGGIVMTSTRRDSGSLDNGLPGIDSLDPNGHAVWTRQAASGSAVADSIAVLGDGTVVTGGSTAGYSVDFGSGALDGCMYLAAHNRDGTLADVVSYVPRGPSCGEAFPWGLAGGPGGAVALAGVVGTAADFGTGTLRFAGATDAMIVMLDTVP